MTLTVEVPDELDHELLAECMRVLCVKGTDYTEGQKGDRVRNFRVAAQDLGLTMEQVWGVYFYKHYAAIRAYVNRGQVESEPIRGRIVDAINYLLLLNRIIEERTQARAE